MKKLLIILGIGLIILIIIFFLGIKFMLILIEQEYFISYEDYCEGPVWCHYDKTPKNEDTIRYFDNNCLKISKEKWRCGSIIVENEKL